MNILKSLFKFLDTDAIPSQKYPQHKNQSTHIKLPNGSIYTGKLVNGKLEGRGTLVYENGERYEGQFHDGMKHGKGKYYYIRGELYIGDWFENKKHGKGQYFYENGQRYMGDFLNNMKHGNGILFQEDGSEFRGTFANNKRHGQGQYLDMNNNKKFKQIYENGKLVSQSQETQQSKSDSVQAGTAEAFNKPVQSQINRQLLSMQDMVYIPRNSLSGSQSLSIEHKVFDSMMTLSPTGLKDEENYFSEEKLKRQNKLNTFFLNNNKHIYIWTEDDVCSWLQDIGFLDYIDAFYKQKIDGSALLLLTEQDLKQLGIVIGDKNDMLKQLELLRAIFRVQSVNDYQALKQKDFKSFNEIKLAFKQKIQSESSASSSDDSQFFKNTALIRQQSSKLQKKVHSYLQKHGIKLNFLIPKNQIEIIKEVGKGGFGQVYLGKWLGQQVAVKKFLKKQGLRNRHIGHFIQEVQLISKLLHPSIVLYMGMCIEDNQYAMITQFLSNGSLFDYLHQNCEVKDLSDEKVFYIIKDIALGMTYLHGKNVVHCDLKSSNVLIDSNWNVKLGDFGLSRIQLPKGGDVRRVGTPHWMAPEILRGQKYSFGSDVYSFGMIIWQLLTQQIPYKKYSTAQIIGMVGRDENHRIAIPKKDDPVMIELMKMCTKRSQAQRPSFSAIVQYLQKHQTMYLNHLQKI